MRNFSCHGTGLIRFGASVLCYGCFLVAPVELGSWGFNFK